MSSITARTTFRARRVAPRTVVHAAFLKAAADGRIVCP
ncbi:Hypothetical protein A7982_06332 [Minicystis rosea]|nr:Hypothetical protein A7982_06332 [Minicystis rosea]